MATIESEWRFAGSISYWTSFEWVRLSDSSISRGEQAELHGFDQPHPDWAPTPGTMVALTGAAAALCGNLLTYTIIRSDMHMLPARKRCRVGATAITFDTPSLPSARAAERPDRSCLPQASWAHS